MASTPDFPDQSPAAAAASAAQLSSLDAQKTALENNLRTQNHIMPVLLDKLGFNIGYDAKGNLTIHTTGSDKQKDITAGLQDRELKALAGELPVNSQLTQQLDQQEAQLKAQLAASLGPDYAATSSGQQALADFRQRKANIIDNSARQDILGITGALNTNQNTVDSTIQTALGVTQAPLAGISLFGQNAQGYGGIVNADNQLRTQQYNAEVQAQNGMFSGIGSLVGTAAGIALAPATGGASLLSTGMSALFPGGSPSYSGGNDPLTNWGIS